MATVGEHTVEQLEILRGLLPESRLLGWPKKTMAERKEILPADIEIGDTVRAGRLVLPNFVALVDGRKVSIEFSPAPQEESWWLNMYVRGDMTFPLIVTSADTEWHTRGGLVPVFDFTIGEEMYDSLYISASSKPSVAKKFLVDIKHRDLILGVGAFKRFSIDRRFVRLTRLLCQESPADANDWVATIKKLIGVANFVESWNPEVDAWE